MFECVWRFAGLALKRLHFTKGNLVFQVYKDELSTYFLYEYVLYMRMNLSKCLEPFEIQEQIMNVPWLSLLSSFQSYVYAGFIFSTFTVSIILDKNGSCRVRLKVERSSKIMLFQKMCLNNTVSALSTAVHKNNIFVNVLVKTSKLQTKQLTK